MFKYIAYYRVSTKKQGDSGLSFEWQQSSVQRFVSREAGVLLAEFSEVETGTRKKKRIEIYKAIELAKAEDATLIVAKLDRLSRDVGFINDLLNSHVKFICLDMPGADETTIGIMSVIAQQEAKRIRERILNALSAKRARGETLGNIDNLRKHGAKGTINSVAVRKELARTHNSKAVRNIKNLRSAGFSYSKIATELNEQGFSTTRGNKFTPKQVQLLFLRYC